MGRYAARRLLEAIPTLFLVSVVVLTLMQMGREAARPENKEKLEALRHEMGLDKPIPVQYLYWLRDLSQGDFGDSLRNKKPSIELIAQKFPVTLELVAGAILFALLVGFPLGILAAVKR